MKHLLSMGIAAVFLTVSIPAQVTQPQATPADVKFFRFLLTTLGSTTDTSVASAIAEQGVVKRFGLQQQELDIIRSPVRSYRTILSELKPALAGIMAGRATLSLAEREEITAVLAQRDQKVQSLATQILLLVRPVTADRLRVPGRIMADTLRTAAAGK